jgi:hypothetical protein
VSRLGQLGIGVPQHGQQRPKRIVRIERKDGTCGEEPNATGRETAPQQADEIFGRRAVGVRVRD